MNLSEKRRAEQMLKEAFDNREGNRPMSRKPEPPASLVKKVAALQQQIDALLDAARFQRDSHGGLVALNDHPEYVKQRADHDARRITLHAERDELIRQVWADELTWDDIKKVQSKS